MKAEQIRRAYGITSIIYQGIKAPRTDEYKVSFVDREPILVRVPACGSTDNTVFRKIAAELTAAGIAPKY